MVSTCPARLVTSRRVPVLALARPSAEDPTSRRLIVPERPATARPATRAGPWSASSRTVVRMRQVTLFAGSRPDPSATTTPLRSWPAALSAVRSTPVPVAEEPGGLTIAPRFFKSSSAVVLSDVTSIWVTMSARGGESMLASSTTASSGAIPAWADLLIATSRSSSRSSKNAAANAAGSPAGVFRPFAVFSACHHEKPSFTERALRGPAWFCWPGLKRSGQDSTYRRESNLLSSPMTAPEIELTPASTSLSARCSMFVNAISSSKRFT